MRPRIGITTSTLDRGPEGPIQRSAATHLDYASCIYNAGGLPLLLPSLSEDNAPDEVLAHLDGVLFSGGGDIDSSYWHEACHPASSTADSLRDKFEIHLLRAALKLDLPIFGICRGVQVMAVATGGDLWQDIPSQYPDNSLPHHQKRPRHEASHTVTITPDTRLANILWPEDTDNYQLPVNSFHHQATRNCGRLFFAVATSPDGIIEALAIPDATFALGVQWHPEAMAETESHHARLFSAFVSAAGG